MKYAKVVDIRTRMDKIQVRLMEAPEWFRKGKRIFENMDPEGSELVGKFIFQCVLMDVEQGLKGKDTEIFFQEIDKRYENYEAMSEKNKRECIFCDEESDAGICLGCYLKIFGRDKIREALRIDI